MHSPESVFAMKRALAQQNFGSANSRAPYVQEITFATPPVENLRLHNISLFIYSFIQHDILLINLLTLLCLHFQTCLKPDCPQVTVERDT